MKKENETESIVVTPRDPFSDVILSENAEELAKFMDEPVTAIAETITGLLAAGSKAWLPLTGRMVQAILNAKMYQQLGREIKELRDKGKIPDDFAEKKYGFQSWVELLKTIDEESPDQDKLYALKAMFYSVNKIGIEDSERIVNYQLFQIAKRLTSNQLLILKAVRESQNASEFGRHNSQGVIPWAAIVSARLGHGLTSLVSKEETVLSEQGLIKAPLSPQDSRLTDLGWRLCENIERYRIETKGQ
jgi:hypothetical protein